MLPKLRQAVAGARTQHRGVWIESDLAERVSATIHPSAILRQRDDSRHCEYQAFVDDLRVVSAVL
jgi:hypothetical protein